MVINIVVMAIIFYIGEGGEEVFNPGFFREGLKREGGAIGDDGGELVPDWVVVH